MRKILFTAITMAFVNLNAQKKNDSTFCANEKEALVYMRNALGAHHRDFKIGAYFSIAGFAITSVGLVKKKDDAVYVGVGIGFIGSIIMISSHNHLGDAARWTFTPTGVTIKF